MAVRGVREYYREADPSYSLVLFNSLQTFLYFSTAQRVEPFITETNHLDTLTGAKQPGKQVLSFFNTGLQLLLS